MQSQVTKYKGVFLVLVLELQDLQKLRADHKDQYRVSCNQALLREWRSCQFIAQWLSGALLFQELFASSTLRKTLSLPLNGKWVFAENRREGSLYKPEWMLDTLTSGCSANMAHFVCCSFFLILMCGPWTV